MIIVAGTAFPNDPKAIGARPTCLLRISQLPYQVDSARYRDPDRPGCNHQDNRNDHGNDDLLDPHVKGSLSLILAKNNNANTVPAITPSNLLFCKDE